jgi:hypothetical protein
MSSGSSDASGAANDDVDIGEYCRRVEEHLSRVNQGHLVRIVGSGFELVRTWATDGVPFSVVCRAIDMKAERHRAGRSTRPLRIEFCDADVRAVFQDWKRAVGVTAVADPAPGEAADDARRPSLSKHLDRVVTALTRAAGRLDTPAALRDGLTTVLEGIVGLRESLRGRRGVSREDIGESLTRWDAALMEAARMSTDADMLGALRRDAAAELQAFRPRMTAETWERSLDVAATRLLRERLHLPTLEF